MTKARSAISYVLGHLSMWWGFVVAVIYAVGLGLTVRPDRPFPSGSIEVELPWILPTIGLSLAILGALLHSTELHRSRPWIAGLVLNGLALVFTVVAQAISETP
jgi:hypothetical protein